MRERVRDCFGLGLTGLLPALCAPRGWPARAQECVRGARRGQKRLPNLGERGGERGEGKRGKEGGDKKAPNNTLS